MQTRFEQLETELARRLAPILRDVPTPLFEELVTLIASIQYERESEAAAHRAQSGAPASRAFIDS